MTQFVFSVQAIVSSLDIRLTLSRTVGIIHFYVTIDKFVFLSISLKYSEIGNENRF